MRANSHAIVSADWHPCCRLLHTTSCTLVCHHVEPCVRTKLFFCHCTSILSTKLQSLAVPRPANPGLGAIPNHRGHGVPWPPSPAHPDLTQTPRAQILVGILRHYVVLLLQSSPKKLPRNAIREQ